MEDQTMMRVQRSLPGPCRPSGPSEGRRDDSERILTKPPFFAWNLNSAVGTLGAAPLSHHPGADRYDAVHPVQTDPQSIHWGVPCRLYVAMDHQEVSCRARKRQVEARSDGRVALPVAGLCPGNADKRWQLCRGFCCKPTCSRRRARKPVT